MLDSCEDDNGEWVQIVGGGYAHTAALTKEGKVFTWGRNKYGQLGHGDKKYRFIPTKVESLDGLVIVKIACGRSHTVAFTDKGDMYTWYECQKDSLTCQICNRNLIYFENIQQGLECI